MRELSRFTIEKSNEPDIFAQAPAPDTVTPTPEIVPFFSEICQVSASVDASAVVFAGVVFATKIVFGFGSIVSHGKIIIN